MRADKDWEIRLGEPCRRTGTILFWTFKQNGCMAFLTYRIYVWSFANFANNCNVLKTRIPVTLKRNAQHRKHILCFLIFIFITREFMQLY
jgi:hypothetical protein